MRKPSNLYTVKTVLTVAARLGVPEAEQLQTLPREMVTALYPEITDHGLSALLKDWVPGHALSVVTTSHLVSYIKPEETLNLRTALTAWATFQDRSRTRTVVFSKEREEMFRQKLEPKEWFIAEAVSRLILIYPYHAITQRLVPRQAWMPSSSSYLNLIRATSTTFGALLPVDLKHEWDASLRGYRQDSTNLAVRR